MKTQTLVAGLAGLILGVAAFGVGLSGHFGHGSYFYALAAVLTAIGGTGVGYSYAYRRVSTVTRPTQTAAQKS